MTKANKITTIVCIIMAVAVIASAALGTMLLSSKPSEAAVIPVSTVEGLTAADELHLTAHRGLSVNAPENTLAAFTLAGQADYYACEFDIHATADDTWVVMHDDDIKRTTNGKGKIAEMTYSELCEYTIDSGNGIDRYPDEKIPTLEQVLEICITYGMRPMIEIKGGDSENIKELAALLNEKGLIENVIIISFVQEYLTQFRQECPEAQLWLLVSKITDETLTFCTESYIDGIAFNYSKKSNSEYIDDIQQAKLVAAAWTVDDPAAAVELVHSGVHYITTNCITP